VGDSLALAREALQKLPDDRRTHLVTSQELVGALDDLAAALPRLPARLDDLVTGAGKAADLARALGQNGPMPRARTCCSGSRPCTGRSRATAATSPRMPRRVRRWIVGCGPSRSRPTPWSPPWNSTSSSTATAACSPSAISLPRIRSTPYCYDLLASEARLASFMAIALGEVPARHWFRLGREVTPIGRGAALVSWSGSMFEYLMPSLVMRAPRGSLIEKTNSLIVRRQIDYATSRGVPWGISESAYNARDKELTYQYSNFGVPGLGFKRGLGEDVVIAPYATALAAMVDPAAAYGQLHGLAEKGGRGRYGFYEALDFTPSRLPEGRSRAIVRAYMAHHQGMTVVAIANALLDGVMRTRFHAEPIVQATELLLQERTPRDVAVAHPRTEEVSGGATVDDLEPALVRRLRNPNAASPSVHLLSNGRYSVMMTAAGSGYSRWDERAVTRWREDTTRDDWGSYLFLRDVASGEVWSAAYQPRGTRPDRYDVMFAEDRAEFVRYDGDLTTTLDVVVSPEDDAEVRRVSIANAGREPRDIELTSFAEIALAPPLADAAHQAFPSCSCRPSTSPPPVPSWRRVGAAARAKPSCGRPISRSSRASDRRGRDRNRSRPLSRPRQRHRQRRRGAGRSAPLQHRRTVLDPIFALRRRVRVAAAAWRASPSGRSRALARGAARCHRQASGHQRLRTGRHAGMDTGAGSVAPSRRRPRPGQPLSAPRRTRDLRQSGAALLVGYDRRGLAGQHLLWARASRATCRSCWCASTRSRIRASSARSCALASIGTSRDWWSMSSS
jgi:cyclic beta-1,2-glucan synthetase